MNFILPHDSRKAEIHLRNHILLAKSSIQIAMYHFSYKKLAKTLIKAKNKGVDITVCIDKSNRKKKAIKLLKKAGIKIHSPKTKMHCKFMIIDSNTVTHGSVNWTKKSLFKSFELLQVSNDPTPFQITFNHITQD